MNKILLLLALLLAPSLAHAREQLPPIHQLVGEIQERWERWTDNIEACVAQGNDEELYCRRRYGLDTDILHTEIRTLVNLEVLNATSIPMYRKYRLIHEVPRALVGCMNRGGTVAECVNIFETFYHLVVTPP